MDAAQRNWFVSTGVALAALSLYGGALLRNRVDVNTRIVTPNPAGPHSYLASQEDEIDVPAGDYFTQMMQVLENYYVEPIKNEVPLAEGAVRGMVVGLNDPRSQFFNPTEFASMSRSEDGRFDGIGAAFRLGRISPTSPKAPNGSDDTFWDRVAPKLLVAMVVPGSPAASAGLRPGDRIMSVGDKWVTESAAFDRLRKMQFEFEAHKVSYSTVNDFEKSLVAKLKHAVMPLKAWREMVTGSNGAISVVWKHGNATKKATIRKGTWTIPPVKVLGDTIALHIQNRSGVALANAIRGKRIITLDLRNNVSSNFEDMEQCLSVVAPKRVYGELVLQSGPPDKPFELEGGGPGTSRLTVVADETTRGCAQALARILVKKAGAKLVGSLSSRNVYATEMEPLPDGSGYSLNIGKFKMEAAGPRKT